MVVCRILLPLLSLAHVYKKEWEAATYWQVALICLEINNKK